MTDTEEILGYSRMYDTPLVYMQDFNRAILKTTSGQ
jgi:hypothetical protein